MKESTINISMELIGIASEAKGQALLGLKKAKLGDFQKAKELVKKAKFTILKAHKVHAEIIQGEAQGKDYEINTLFIHSQDHFTAGLVICDLVEHILEIYELIKEFKR